MMEDLPRDSLCDLFKEPIGVGILPMSLFPPASNYIQQTAGKIRSARMYFANRQKISYQDVAPVGGSASRSLLVSNLQHDRTGRLQCTRWTQRRGSETETNQTKNETRTLSSEMGSIMSTNAQMRRN
jgi:hypothetical protein